ncbi:MAG: radical SAM domain-containing protein [Acidimicrobiia bacterium]|nr:radical SAM domain-containing protein [Acidimicrobiia bacterium]
MWRRDHPTRAAGLRRVIARVRHLERRTRPVPPEVDAAFRRRWEELPEHVRTDAQMVGRKSLGCEGTHGVFPKCNFSCTPCYHSEDANRVRVDGPHTVAQVREQMSFLRERRGPASFAQLIGGEVSLLEPEDHAAALAEMWAAGRIPMSFSHGDVTYDYLREVSVGLDGQPRFPSVSWALHIDTTMAGRTGAKKPEREAELHPFRAEACARFARLRREHGVSSYVAHNMTVTPANLGEVSDVVATCARMGFRMFSFQPAAYVGNDRRWREGFRTISDDDVWSAVERGVGRSLPYRTMQFGDLRCNRVTWGAFVGDRYVPLLEDDDPDDAAARDAWYEAFRGSWMHQRTATAALRLLRTLLRHPAAVPVGLRWLRRFVARAGGLRRFRYGVQPVTFVMHSFIDAELVGPAWDLLRAGERSDDPQVLAAQERLEACVYAMAHPESDEVVPACVQHSVLDPGENRQLVELLPLRRR